MGLEWGMNPRVKANATLRGRWPDGQMVILMWGSLNGPTDGWTNGGADGWMQGERQGGGRTDRLN